MNYNRESLYSELNQLTPTEIELLLLYSYYYSYLQEPENGESNPTYLAKREEYAFLIKPFTHETKLKIARLYKQYSKRVKDFYGTVYSYVHKQNKYKQLLMLI